VAYDLGDAIEDARDLDATFTEQRHPTEILIRYATRLQRRLVGLYLDEAPLMIRREHTQSLPLASFDAGFTVPNFLEIVDIEVRDTTQSPVTRAPVDKVDLKQRFALNMNMRSCWFDFVYVPAVVGPPAVAAYTAPTCHLAGRDINWQGWNEVAILYVPYIADFDATTDPAGQDVELPDESRDLFIAKLAAFMASRTSTRPDLVQEAADEDLKLRNLLTHKDWGGTTFRVQDVMR